ncbi:MAG: alpha/beta hydrolase [Bacteroidales bacterium]|nr:alpha/beta hydrolase [Bacteroidales bacterium]
MKKGILLLFISCIVSVSYISAAQYHEDILGKDFLARTMVMEDDYDGKVISTLIKYRNTPSEKAVLYVHGFNDYFFQKEMAYEYSKHGYDFYAVDLRKYGRSILPHQTPFFVMDIREYFPDLDSALAIIRSEGHSEIILSAHSTGGLITSLYVNDKKNEPPCSALVLNSPFFDWYLSPFLENIGIPVVAWLGKYFPRAIAMKASKSQYGASLHKSEHGEWDYDLQKKRDGNDMTMGWIRAIDKAQGELQKGLSINIPVLVLCSSASMPEDKKWNEAYQTHDIVLDTRDIQKYAKKLGPDVTIQTVDGGKHDLILSIKRVRDKVYNIIFAWLKKWNL